MHNHYIANTFKGQTDLSAFYIVNPITFWDPVRLPLPTVGSYALIETS